MSDTEPDTFIVDYDLSDIPWPEGIKHEVFENCNSKNDALNRFIELKGKDLATRIIEIRPLTR